MLSIQRAFFKKELIEKLKYWLSPQAKIDMYSKSPARPKIGIQRVQNGFYYLSDNLIYFSNLTNGQIVRIKKLSQVSDWDLYTDLYKISIESKKFRMDIPGYSEIIVDNLGEKWEYAELKSPGNQYGFNVYNEVFSTVVIKLEEFSEDVLNDNWTSPVNLPAEYFLRSEEYFSNYITQFAEIVNAAKIVSEKKKHNLLPGNLLSCNSFYKDSLGYFWSDFDHDNWTTPVDKLVTKANIIFATTLDFAERSKFINQQIKDSLIHTARETWKTI